MSNAVVRASTFRSLPTQFKNVKGAYFIREITLAARFWSLCSIPFKVLPQLPQTIEHAVRNQNVVGLKLGRDT